MSFCPKCGEVIKEEAKFCHNCGYTLKEDLNNTEKINKDEDAQDVKHKFANIKSYLKEMFSKNSHSKGVIAGIIVCSLILVFIFIGKTISSPNGIVVSFQNAVTKNDVSSLNKILYFPDESPNFTSNNLGPLFISYKATPSEFSDVIDNLNAQVQNLKNVDTENQSSDFYIKRVGNTLLFFPQYKIAVKPTYLTVTSNVEGADILVNGKEIIKTDNNNFSQQLGPYIPGTYSVVAKANGNFGDIQKVTKVDFLNTNQSDTINALNGLYLQVSSNYNNNEVYINGKDTGKSVNAGDTVGPVASGSNIYAISSYNGVQIKSSNSNISDENKSINFDYTKQEDTVNQEQSNLNNLITGYCGGLASALSYGDTKTLLGYMYPGSILYNQQMGNAKSYSSNGFYEQYDSAVVNSYTINPDGASGIVDTTEVYDINDNVNSYSYQTQTKTYENVYKFQYNKTSQSFQLSERVSAVEK